MKVIEVVFYRNASGAEPVRDWLIDLSRADRRTIGEDLKTVEFGWPLGMPLVDSFSGKANKGLWEVRSKLASRRIARVIFAEHHGRMVLLHGFIKKSQQTPKKDLDLARRRYRNLLSQEQGNE